MKKRIFVMIRYSVLSKNRSKNWVVGRKEFDEYREELFHPDRLSAREELFQKITLPSLVHQSKSPSKDWLTVYILVSEEMPKNSLDSLSKIVGAYDWISIVPVPVEKTQINAPLMNGVSEVEGDICYASVRLDDDDALASTYFEDLFRYIEKPFAGFGVSFGKGVAGVISNGKFADFKDYYYPKNAQGLAFIQYKSANEKVVDMSVYDAGIHTRIDQNHPVILDSRKCAFMRTIHQHADTAADKALASILKLQSLEISNVTAHFSFDPSLMP